MVRIRLKRVGAKKHPFYRIVVADQRAARDGAFIEQVGTYDPFPDPPEIKIDEEKVAKWMKNGAQPSDSVVSLFQSHGILPKVGAAAAPKASAKAAPKAAAKATPKAAATATAVADAPVEEAAETTTDDANETPTEDVAETPDKDADEAAKAVDEDDSKETSSD